MAISQELEERYGNRAKQLKVLPVGYYCTVDRANTWSVRIPASRG